MKLTISYVFISFMVLCAQPKEGIEFKVNTISGVILDNITSKPLMDVEVDIFTGNNILKHSTLTDENGFYTENIVGYLWKPKIKFSMHNYQTSNFRIDPNQLDSSNNIIVNYEIVPVPENQRIPDLEKSTITKRAEIFFINGNVFYYMTTENSAERITIRSAIALESKPGFIIMKVNDVFYDVARCYVPQEGRYENLSYILKSLISEPIFQNSRNPIFLDDELLSPSIIYGTVLNLSNGQPVMGAEIILSEPFKRRISDENGQYAFQVQEPGSYLISINPPPRYSNSSVSIPKINMRYGKGGWHKTNFYVEPW
ncbi:MAG: carboxypeptidase-like regulatory domain-containing protein [Candidatus Neomarinimicrobiota bacterium]